MSYQFVREPLRSEEADQLSRARSTLLEKLIIWILIDTGLLVSELCSLTSQDILWQQKALRISGKGGPYGKKSKKRVVPMSNRVRALLCHQLAFSYWAKAGSKNSERDRQQGQNYKTSDPSYIEAHLCDVSTSKRYIIGLRAKSLGS